MPSSKHKSNMIKSSQTWKYMKRYEGRMIKRRIVTIGNKNSCRKWHLESPSRLIVHRSKEIQGEN